MDALPAFCPLPTRCDYLPRPNWEHLADLFAISTRRPRALLCVLTAALFGRVQCLLRGPCVRFITHKTLNLSVAAFNSRQKKALNVQCVLELFVGKCFPKQRATCLPKWRLFGFLDVLCAKQNVSFPSIGQSC